MAFFWLLRVGLPKISLANMFEPENLPGDANKKVGAAEFFARPLLAPERTFHSKQHFLLQIKWLCSSPLSRLMPWQIHPLQSELLCSSKKVVSDGLQWVLSWNLFLIAISVPSFKYRDERKGELPKNQRNLELFYELPSSDQIFTSCSLRAKNLIKETIFFKESIRKKFRRFHFGLLSLGWNCDDEWVRNTEFSIYSCDCQPPFRFIRDLSLLSKKCWPRVKLRIVLVRQLIKQEINYGNVPNWNGGLRVASSITPHEMRSHDEPKNENGTPSLLTAFTKNTISRTRLFFRQASCNTKNNSF